MTPERHTRSGPAASDGTDAKWRTDPVLADVYQSLGTFGLLRGRDLSGRPGSRGQPRRWDTAADRLRLWRRCRHAARLLGDVQDLDPDQALAGFRFIHSLPPFAFRSIPQTLRELVARSADYHAEHLPTDALAHNLGDHPWAEMPAPAARRVWARVSSALNDTGIANK